MDGDKAMASMRRIMGQSFSGKESIQCTKDGDSWRTMIVCSGRQDV